VNFNHFCFISLAIINKNEAIYESLKRMHANSLCKENQNVLSKSPFYKDDMSRQFSYHVFLSNMGYNVVFAWVRDLQPRLSRLYEMREHHIHIAARIFGVHWVVE
jgi:uncharacterized protein YbcV (DUF1398 family)